MDDTTVERLKSYNINIDETKKQELIYIGKQKMISQQLDEHSLYELFKSCIRFSNLYTWIIQLALLFLATIYIIKETDGESSTYIIQSLTVMIILSVAFFMNELFRSFTSGMWELEQTFKYDLRQHTIMKLLVFGLMDLMIVFCLAFISQGVLAISFWKVILYLLVPFNMTCIILFSLFTIWRNNLTMFIFWISSGLALMLIIILSNLFNVYEVDIIYWETGFVISTLILVFIVMNMVRVEKWEVY